MRFFHNDKYVCLYSIIILDKYMYLFIVNWTQYVIINLICYILKLRLCWFVTK